MGLRDRLKGLLHAPPRPTPAPVPAAVAPAAPRRSPVPRAVGREALGRAVVVDVGRDPAPIPGAQRVADLRAFRPGRPVVVVCEDGGWSAGVAERLCALGVEASWLEGGWST